MTPLGKTQSDQSNPNWTKDDAFTEQGVQNYLERLTQSVPPSQPVELDFFNNPDLEAFKILADFNRPKTNASNPFQVKPLLAEANTSKNQVSDITPNPSLAKAVQSELSPEQFAASRKILQNPYKAPWVEFLTAFASQINAGDIDMDNVLVNRGSDECRHSESSPKNDPSNGCTLTVQANTTTRVRVEIRPVEGQEQSIVYSLGFKHSQPFLHKSLLRILGLSAVTWPNMEYGPMEGTHPIKDNEGGDLDYGRSRGHEILRTPFDATVPPPPNQRVGGGVVFDPVVDTLLAGIKECVATGSCGKDWNALVQRGYMTLYLYLYLPTLGLTNAGPAYFKKFGVGFNEIPRKIGDVLDFFSPLFNGKQRNRLAHESNYYNANSKFIGLYLKRFPRSEGKQKAEAQCQGGELKTTDKEFVCNLPIPKDYELVQEINKKRCNDFSKTPTLQSLEKCQKDNPGFLRHAIGLQPLMEERNKENHELLQAINRDRELFGQPPIGWNLGGIFDFISTYIRDYPEKLAQNVRSNSKALDLENVIIKDLETEDPELFERLKGTSHFTIRLNMRGKTLPINFGGINGSLKVNKSSEVRALYYTYPVKVKDPQDPNKTNTETHIGVRLEFTPAKLHNIDLGLQDYHFQAQELSAKKLVFHIPSLSGFDRSSGIQRSPMTLTLQGGMVKGLHLKDQEGTVSIKATKADLDNFEVNLENPMRLFGSPAETQKEYQLRKAACDAIKAQDPNQACQDPKLDILIQGLKGDDLEVTLPGMPELKVENFNFPKVEGGMDFTLQTIKNLLTYRPASAFIRIPHLISNGKLDLKFEGEDPKPKDSPTEIHLSGNSHVKDMSLDTKFLEDKIENKFGFQFSGDIAADITHDRIGTVSFKTEDPATTSPNTENQKKPIEGELSGTILNPLKAEQKVPPPKIDLHMELPHVGVSATGVLNIPKGISRLENATLDLNTADSKLTGGLSGNLLLQKTSYAGQEVDLGRITISPKLSQMETHGEFKAEILEDGFRLSRAPESKTPLQVGFAMDGTNLFHQPDLSESDVDLKVAEKVIKNKIHLDSAKFWIQDLKEIEVREYQVDGKTRRRITKFDGGPFIAHHLQGGGVLWAPLLFWGWVQGNFPQTGGAYQPNKKQKRPNPSLFTDHLPKSARDMIGSEDFFYVENFQWNPENGNGPLHIKNAMLNIHEEDGNEQYGMLWFPEIHFPKESLRGVFGPGGFFIDIFLNHPLRGLFTVNRWPPPPPQKTP